MPKKEEALLTSDACNILTNALHVSSKPTQHINSSTDANSIMVSTRDTLDMKWSMDLRFISGMMLSVEISQ